ncbi:MAG TPA: S41 family peptidase [Usitatibacter sp.]|nr:S41 family peptidase [Usitatibacter sp.]
MRHARERGARGARRPDDRSRRRHLRHQRQGRLKLLSLIAAAAIFTAAATPPAPAAHEQAEDFDAFWHALDEGYAYFGPERAAWKSARDKWRPRAVAAATRSDFIAALEGAIAELRDDHVRLSERSDHSPRRVPYETDVWARWKDGSAYVEAVRPFGDADVAGLRPGLVVSQVDGVPIEQAVRDRLDGGSATPQARDWALRHVLAGPRTGQQRITMIDGGQPRHLVLERTEPRPGGAPVFGRRMGDDRDIGYVRVRYGVDNAKVVARFDAVLNYLDDTRALIIDIRDPPGSGERDVTQALLARFASAEVAWQVHEPGPPGRHMDVVVPRGKAYRSQVLVLVDHWTAGESEALAAGLRAVAGARVVGTRMAGLRGDLAEARLPHSGIVMRYPAHRTLLVTGEPREKMRPDVLIDLAAPQGGPGDPILYAALKLLEPCPGPACRNGPGSPPPAHGSPPR